MFVSGWLPIPSSFPLYQVLVPCFTPADSPLLLPCAPDGGS